MTPDAATGAALVVVVSIAGSGGTGVAGAAVVDDGGIELVGMSGTVVASVDPEGVQATDIVASMQIPNPVDFFRNWTRSDLTTEEKLRQAVKNAAIKARTGDGCCGNHGEVGC
jgi:hypothetical protein